MESAGTGGVDDLRPMRCGLDDAALRFERQSLADQRAAERCGQCALVADLVLRKLIVLSWCRLSEVRGGVRKHRLLT